MTNPTHDSQAWLAELASTPILRYPRTIHLEGSRLQSGDSDHDQTPLVALLDPSGRTRVVIEEKLDAANCGISFSGAGELLLQSRGHYLMGGFGERQFNSLKVWARAHESALLDLLEDRYVLYGEWMAAKHSVFYDALPHLMLEFDVFDRQTNSFMSTPRRHAFLQGSPVMSVPVLYEGEMVTDSKWLWSLLRPSLARTADWRTSFEQAVGREGLDLEMAWRQTDKSEHAEGLYVKVEDDERVLARYKLVRATFTQTILDSDSHHAKRPIIYNGLHPQADLYTPVPLLGWQQLGLQTLRGLEQLQDTLQPARIGGRQRVR